MTNFRLMRFSVLSLVCVFGGLSFGAGNSAKANFERGMLRGKVVDLTGKPVAGAIVAVEQAGGKVIAWTKTDANGEYRISTDPKLALNLKPSHCRGLLEQCVLAASGAAMDALRAAGSTILTPGNTIRTGAVAVASGTPGQDVAQGTASSLPTVGTTPGQVGQAAGGAATNAALLGTPNRPMPPPCTHGQADILISAAGFKETCLADAAYWMDPASVDKSDRIGVSACMQTIKLAPTAGKDKAVVVPDAITLTDLAVQPELAPQGSDIQITVKLNSPDPTTAQKVRVFARLAARNVVVELLPIAGQKDVFGGKMSLARKAPVGPTTLCIGALRTEPIEVKLSGKKSDPLVAFVTRTQDMNGSKPYGYDPFVMASENRLDTKITILPAKGN
jgi:hypothetical protein